MGTGQRFSGLPLVIITEPRAVFITACKSRYHDVVILQQCGHVIYTRLCTRGYIHAVISTARGYVRTTSGRIEMLPQTQLSQGADMRIYSPQTPCS